MRLGLVWGALAPVVLTAPIVRGACERDLSLDRGAPLRISPGPAGFAGQPEACAATELSLQAEAALLIALEDFFGSLEAAAAVRARYAVSPRHWLSLWLPGLSYRYVANATVDAESLDLGAGALGFHTGLPLSNTTELAPFVRVLLPTESIYVNATRYGVEHGFTLLSEPSERTELMAGVVFPLLVTDGSGTLHSAFMPSLSVHASVLPFDWLQALGGAALRFRGGDDSAFEALEPMFGMRFFVARHLRAELATRLPLWGADRTDLGVAVNVGYLLPGQ